MRHAECRYHPSQGPGLHGLVVRRENSQLAKGLFDTTTGKLRREISKSENNLYRAAQKVDPGAVIYATVSDRDYAILRG